MILVNYTGNSLEEMALYSFYNQVAFHVFTSSHESGSVSYVYLRMYLYT